MATGLIFRDQYRSEGSGHNDYISQNMQFRTTYWIFSKAMGRVRND